MASLSTLDSSTGIANNANTAQTPDANNAELTEDQKRRIALVEADYAAKKITKAQEEQKITEIKAENLAFKKPKKQVTQGNSRSVNNAAENEKSRIKHQQELQELLKNKNGSIATGTDLADFTEKLKNSTDIGQSALVDKTV